MGLDWDLSRHGRPLLDWLSLIDDHLSEISALASAVSVAGWILAGIYQVKTIHRTKEVDGFSSLFLLSWVVGDLSNVLGSFFTGQMFFQKLLSVSFMTLDGILFLQWIYYTYYYYEDPMLLIAEAEIPSISRNHYSEQVCSENVGVESSSKSKSKSPAVVSEISEISESSSPVSIRQTKPVSVSDILVSISAGSSVSSAAPIPISSQALQETAVTVMSDASYALGTVCGYICSAMYMFSLIPQLVKNFQDKSTGTVSIYIFLADLVGNFGYSLSILSAARLLSDPTERSEFLIKEMPFLCGTCVSFVLELVLMYQFYIYRNSHLHHHHYLHNQPSRDVMPETMALITTPDSNGSAGVDVPGYYKNQTKQTQVVVNYESI